jgi:sugar lactone lactonase YvrE
MKQKDKTYLVYYQRPGSAFTFFERRDLTLAGLRQTHVFLCQVRAAGREQVFAAMQGERWSPDGEGRALIEEKGLEHTSMSVNDVVRDPDGSYWQCLATGWRRLP